MSRFTLLATAAAATGIALSAPAAAQDYYYEDAPAYEYETGYDDPYYEGGYETAQYDYEGTYQAQRAAWLDECRRRVRRDGDGAVIGGLAGAAIGGVIGNRVAGRGDRVIGTVVGAGVGGVAGAAIGNEVDNRNARDECEAYLLDHEARYRAQQQYHAQGGYYRAHPGETVGYTYAVPMMVVRVPVQREVECTETVEEYVTYETVYETETYTTTVPAAKPVRYAKPSKTVRYAK